MLGALLGLANLAAIAFAITFDLREGGEAFGTLVMLGALPALAAGVALGDVAHRTRTWSVGARYAVIGIPALVVLLLCGCVIIPLAYYIPFGCVPTLCAVTILERFTRETSSLPPAIGWRRSAASADGLFVPRADPVALGIMLGLANLVLIAIGMSGVERAGHHHLHHHGTETCSLAHPEHSIGLAVFVIGLLPAVVTGAISGLTAHRCRDWPVWSRRLVIVPPPLAVVVIVGGGVFQAYAFVLPALIPTLVAALWLERSTREGLLPVARAL